MERWTGAAGVVSPVAVLAGSAVGALSTPAYDWPTAPLSVIGTTGGPGAVVFTAGLLLGGVAAVWFAAGIRRDVGPVVAGLCGVVGVSLAGAGLFPSVDGTVGLLHALFGAGALFGIWLLLWAAGVHDWLAGARRRGAAIVLLGTATLAVWLPYDLGIESAQLGYGAAEVVTFVAFGLWSGWTARRLGDGGPSGSAGSAVRTDGGLPDTDAVLVRQPLVVPADAAVETIGDSAVDPRDVLGPDPPVHTASLFLCEAGTGSLVWYFELTDVSGPRTEGWFDLPDEIREVVDDPGTWDVFGDPEGSLAVHAALPGRPRTIPTAAGDEAGVVRTTDGNGPATDVVLLRIAVRSGWPAWLLAAFVRLRRRLADVGWVKQRADAATRPVLEAEQMYTESIFVDGTDLLWYMETADYAEAAEAYQTSDSRLARVSEEVLSRVFEHPEVLGDPEPSSDYRLLAHAVSPDRP